MKTKVKIVKRARGYQAIVTYPWGESTKLGDYATKAQAQVAADREIDRKRQYTLSSQI